MNGDDPTGCEGCEGMYYSCILYYIKGVENGEMMTLYMDGEQHNLH